jgi:hydroxyethylthiazole kinase-like uncharacterized protein yjeF
MKVLTAQQMREADRQTIERGTPADALMERAARGLVSFLESEFAPLARQRVVIVCGAGNNGGDGLMAGRLLKTRVAALQVVRVTDSPGPVDRDATIVIDALLGTGWREPVEGRYADLIRSINQDFPHAKVVAVDIPSAMRVRADYTVTFAAPKAEMLLNERAGNAGKLIVADIGIPADLTESDLELSEARDFAPLFTPRKRDSNKGDFGHVLVVGGAPGKTGAAAMTGLAALRMGAGLVTVACSDPSRLAPELMTQPLDRISLEKMTVLAIGPGLGINRELVARLTQEAAFPTVIDADGLNSIAGTDFRGHGAETVLTPHPGEMARLTGAKVTDRIATAREFSGQRNVCLVLKGFRTLIAFPDGKVWINPTGSPSMAKGGTGDILTGLIAGMVAQFPHDIPTAVRGAVWLHGRAGEIAAAELTEQGVLATDLLTYLPHAIREIRS